MSKTTDHLKTFVDRGRSAQQEIDAILAGNEFRQSLLSRADLVANGGPLWHGWAIMEAFQAGVKWAKEPEPSKLLTWTQIRGGPAWEAQRGRRVLRNGVK